MKSCLCWVSAALTIAFASAAVLGCECPQWAKLEQELAWSDIVFSGEATRISPGPRETEVTFRALSVWKGARTDTIVLWTANPGKACGFEFKQNRQYLVYASIDGTTLRTSTCTRTKPAEYAYDDIEKLTDQGWSLPVNGLRGRISLIPAYHGDSPFFRVLIEIQSVAQIMGQRPIRFHPDRLELRVVDQSGIEIPAVEPMFNGFSPDWKEILIPSGGTIKFNVSYPGAGYLRRDMPAIDLAPKRIWPLTPNAYYFITAKLVIPPQKDDHPLIDWSGTLEMPVVVLRPFPRKTGAGAK